ncbi:MAG: hypothetical protein EWV55_11625 [Microcystis viridis Mv_BB_P_19951000_S69]|uniref:Uncharacterized protein n=1 Tax=Microcystis viridis Mv_BB_P_19951000_S68D TaxID=2486270 RepID=A0A552HC85_MICVR|nr:MAG: hypothetical protein EWV77_19710 [Microcystis viridis Mv_BB_P_19951000_S68D]TRU71118.1 MAG: hypothetical protein EWV47_17685 [Microcystis viridis Mv_BB_P_19951000_S68]TRU74089.1 MAG: hypothetical protein EWV55_11625 [Microcystis viridis Mv_BB_P_19951000_S69]TRU88967.1 MAG: hypothetical protein EWV46_04835 [Microcystis viridis Mv_BB_P_19951000_S69D]
MNLKTLLDNIFRLFCHHKSARYWSNRGEILGTFPLKMPKTPHTPQKTFSANPRYCSGGSSQKDFSRGNSNSRGH